MQPKHKTDLLRMVSLPQFIKNAIPEEARSKHPRYKPEGWIGTDFGLAKAKSMANNIGQLLHEVCAMPISPPRSWFGLRPGQMEMLEVRHRRGTVEVRPRHMQLEYVPGLNQLHPEPEKEQESIFPYCEHWEELLRGMREVYALKAQHGQYSDIADRALQEVIPARMLGSGCFSNVYECPWDSTKAIRWGHRRKVDGWLDYVRMILDNKGFKNPLLPEIYNLAVYEEYYLALVERYDCTWDRARGWDADDIRYAGVEEVQLAGNGIAKVLSRMSPAVRGRVDGSSDEWELHAWRLKDFLVANGSDPDDCHDGNIMVHKETRRLIVTDPIGSSSNSDRSSRVLKLLGVPVYLKPKPEDEIAF